MKERLLLTFLILTFTISATISYSQAYRLKGFSHGNQFGGSYQAVDSITYHYSSGRGSAGVEVITRQFGMGDQYLQPVGTILCDSAVHRWLTPGQTSYIRDSQGFDAMNRPLFFEERWFGPAANQYSSRRFYTSYYNNSPNIQTVLEEIMSGGSGTWNSTSLDTFEYDMNNNLVRILHKVAGGSSLMDNKQTLYTYNNGVLSQLTIQNWNNSNSTWVNDTRWDYYYYTTGILQKTVLTNLNSITTDSFDITGVPIFSLGQYQPGGMGPYINGELSTFTANGVLVTEMNTQVWSGTGWQNDRKEVYDYTNNNETSRYYLVWSSVANSFDTTFSQHKAYNSANLLTSFDSYWHGVNPPSPDSSYRLYYQTYNPLSVQTQKSTIDLNVYPVPARNVLYVTARLSCKSASAVSIFDMQGRVVRQFSRTNSSQLQESIPVSDLHGEYILTIFDGKERASKRFTVQ